MDHSARGVGRARALDELRGSFFLPTQRADPIKRDDDGYWCLLEDEQDTDDQEESDPAETGSPKDMGLAGLPDAVTLDPGPVGSTPTSSTSESDGTDPPADRDRHEVGRGVQPPDPIDG